MNLASLLKEGDRFTMNGNACEVIRKAIPGELVNGKPISNTSDKLFWLRLIPHGEPTLVCFDQAVTEETVLKMGITHA